MTIAQELQLTRHIDLANPPLSHGDCLWLRQGDGFIGYGQAARWDISPGKDRFAMAEALFAGFLRENEPIEPSSQNPIAFGAFTFAEDSPGSVLVVPQRLVSSRSGETKAVSFPKDVEPHSSPRPITSHNAIDWVERVSSAIDIIHSGRIAKVVLARDLTIETGEPIDTPQVLSRLASRFPSCFTFSVDGFIGATPELLVRRKGNEVTSLMLAGSAPRGVSPAEDMKLRRELIESTKDQKEHRLAVESLREALDPFCEELTTEPQPYVLQLDNVQHLATRAVGRLITPTPSVLSLVAALHPTAAVCGTPTPVALDTIRELEGMDRGRYAGPVGWTDAEGNGEWGIALRCAEVNGAQARLFAGCGIVSDSDPAAEYAETELKLDAMRQALEG